MTDLAKHCCSGAAPIFIVSSGRSGTRALEEALSTCTNVTTHHEYMVNIIQPLAVRYWMQLTDRSEVLKILGATYGAAIKYAETPVWIDSSNKASWVIDLLAELFPNARFVHLVRDGRKVVSSYFHKLGNECYDDRSTAILAKYADRKGSFPLLSSPPPEKKYWWPIPTGRHPAAEAFKSWDQFERIAFHWSEINHTIIKSLDHVPQARHIRVHLEELISRPDALQGLFDFMELGSSDQAFETLQRPLNVNRPENNLLSDEELAKFGAIADVMMTELGYHEKREYLVNY